MKVLVYFLLICFTLAGNVNADVLVFSPDGTYTTKHTIAEAATASDTVGKTIIVTSPQYLSANLVWPADRELQFNKGGYVVAGAYRLTGLKESRPEWFGTNSLPGSTDMTTAIQNAAAAAYKLIFNANDSYKVAGSVILNSGQTVVGNGATITQSSINTTIFSIVGRSNIEISGLKLVGYIHDFSDSDSSLSVGVYSDGGESNIFIHNNSFTGFSYSAIRLKGAKTVKINNNLINGVGKPILLPVISGKSYGVLADKGCDDVQISGNTISQTAQGLRLEQSSNVIATGNHIFNIVGQHGIYAGSGLTNIMISNNEIHDTALMGIKVQASDSARVDNINIKVNDNILSNIGDTAISIQNANMSGAIHKNKNISITGNLINKTIGSGINIMQTTGGNVANNTVISSGFSGILLSESSWLSVSSNSIIDSRLSGIRDAAPCTVIDVKNNQLINNASANFAGDNFGIFIQGGSEYNIAGNYISDANAQMKYALYLFAAGGDNNSLTITDNVCPNSSDYALRLGNTVSVRRYAGNYLKGTLGITFNDPMIPTIASAATITIPTTADVVTISGTTNISRILTNGHSGHTVTLIFQDALTLSKGIFLSADNFVAKSNDTITLSCDGKFWHEVSRSVK